LKLAHIVVHGRVQGVGFRWFVQGEAERTGLSGTVKNLVDGSVEIWVNGSEKNIEDLMGRLQVGNGHSNIMDKTIKLSDSQNNWNGFRIIT